RSQQSPNPVAARRNKRARHEQCDHIEWYPVSVEVERREKNKHQSEERDNCAEDVISVAIRPGAAANRDYDFGVGLRFDLANGGANRLARSVIESGTTHRLQVPKNNTATETQRQRESN